MTTSPRTFDLTRMSVSDLRGLAGTIDAIANAAGDMACDEPVRIDLTAGPSISFPLFPTPASAPVQVRADPPADPNSVSARLADLPVTRQIWDDPAPVDSVATFVRQGAAELAAPIPEPSAPQGPRSMERASKNGEPWTNADDDAIIAGVKAHPEMSTNGVSKVIAPQIGRTHGAVSSRLKLHLSDRADRARGQVDLDDVPEETAPVPAPKASPAILPPDAAPIWHREVNAWLNTLGYVAPWSPGIDLDLVTGLARGLKLGAVALDLGIDAADCKARFHDLKLAATPEDGEFGIAQQTRLIEVLRARAERAQQVSP